MKKNSIARKTALAGCIKNQTTSFTRTTSTLADINLNQDTFHSRYIDQIVVLATLQHLPNISGMGWLRDLQVDNKAMNDSLFKIRRLEK